MKTIIFVFILSFLTFGCKKDEPAVPEQSPGAPPVTGDSLPPKLPEPPGDRRIPVHARMAVAHITDLALLRNHATAAKAYLNLPDSAMPMPIPPSSRPFKNPKLRGVEGNMVVYMFETAEGRIGDMALIKHALGSDTIWIPLHILPM